MVAHIGKMMRRAWQEQKEAVEVSNGRIRPWKSRQVLVELDKRGWVLDAL